METNEERSGRVMMLGWGRVKRAQAGMWSEWMIIGEGLLAGRHWAMRQAKVNRPEGRGYCLALSEWLERWKVHDMDNSDRAKLLQLMEERPAVEEWRASLTPHERRNLNNPTIVWRKWKALGRARQSKSPAGARLRRANEQLQARVRELEEELEATRSRVRELEEELQTARANTVEPAED